MRLAAARREQAETDELGKPASPQHGEHPRVARLPLCGGRPLEHVLVGDCHPPEGAAGRVEGVDRLLGGHDRAEQRLPQQFEDARQCAREIAAGQREPPAVQDGAHRAQKRRERAREEGQRTEQQRGPLRQKSRRDHAGKRRRRRQRAAEVVEELVFCEQADPDWGGWNRSARSSGAGMVGSASRRESNGAAA